MTENNEKSKMIENKENSEKIERVRADIDLDAFEHNLRLISASSKAKRGIIAVIKADGYGHGALPLARLMEKCGDVWGYALATVQEARTLREGGIRKPILILGYTFPGEERDIAVYGLRPGIFSYEAAERISAAVPEGGDKIRIHIKVDTGMSRIGFLVTEAAADEICRIAELPNICIEGIFTHFSRADEREKGFTHNQASAFAKMGEMLKERGLYIPIRHASNSAAILDLPEYHMDLVRAGILLYGLWPSEEMRKDDMGLRPVLSIKSSVIRTAKLSEGIQVSYGGTYRLKRDEIIATVPVGYGDGYPRGLSNKGYVLIRGEKAPICGRVCMDYFMVNVTDIPGVKVGDEVTLVGSDGGAHVTLEELGELSGRFNYEFACDLGTRIPRRIRTGEARAPHSAEAEILDEK